MRQAGHRAVRKRTIVVNDKMQRGYRYDLTAPSGRNFDSEFRPQLTPAEMLRLGVFCGKYLTDCKAEFPRSWFSRAKLAKERRDCSLNYFGVDASQPLSVCAGKDGFIATILAAGSNGIAVTISAAVFPKRTRGRSDAGRRSASMCGEFSEIVSHAT
jgi:hypothetical protein